MLNWIVWSKTDHLTVCQQMTYWIELLEIELFDHLIACKKWLIFNWIVSDT